MKHLVRMMPCALETRDAGSNGGGPVIAGYFALFNSETQIMRDWFEQIAPDAFDRALKEDDVRCLINHDSRLVVGRTSAKTLMLRTDDKGLFGEASVNEHDTEAMNAWYRVQRGDVSQCSFGFDILDSEERYDPETDELHSTLRDVKLYEVSICTFPAYLDTSIEARTEEYCEKKLMEHRAKIKAMWEADMKERILKWH